MTDEIVLIGDDRQLLQRLRQVLDEDGYALECAALGPAALRRLDETAAELAILVVKPGERSWRYCRRLLASSDVALLLILLAGGDMDRVQGLEIGADECLAWPCAGPLLAARVRALLRTRDRFGRPRRPAGYLADRDLVIDLSRQEVWRDGEPVALTATEMRVLACFVRHVGEVLTHERLAAEVWAPVRAGTRPAVYSYIRSLRQKLEPEPARPRRILTQRGQGYLFTRLNEKDSMIRHGGTP